VLVRVPDSLPDASPEASTRSLCEGEPRRGAHDPAAGGYRGDVRVDRGMLGWGAFFITAGGVPLAVQAGALPPGALDRAWSAWPLILVGIGIGMIFRKTALEVVGGLIVSATMGLMVGGVIAGGGFGDVTGSASEGCGPGDSGTPFEVRSGTLAQDAQVRVACG